MANTLKSWMILNNAAADIPTAGTTGAHDFNTDTLVPYYDNGTAKVPWRENFAIPLFLPATVAGSRAIIASSGVSYDSWGGTNSITINTMDFTRFRQARLNVRYNALVGTVTMRAQDTAAGAVIASESLGTTAWTTHVGTWTALNAGTYGNTSCPFEIQYRGSTASDSIDVGSVFLELR